RSHYVIADRTHVQLIEDGSAHQFHVPVASVHAPQQARGKPRSRGFHEVAIRPSLVLAHLDQLLLELIRAEAAIGAKDEVGDLRTRGACERHAAVAVGAGKIADRLSPDQVIAQRAFINYGYGLRLDSLIVHVVIAAQREITYLARMGI